MKRWVPILVAFETNDVPGVLEVVDDLLDAGSIQDLITEACEAKGVRVEIVETEVSPHTIEKPKV